MMELRKTATALTAAAVLAVGTAAPAAAADDTSPDSAWPDVVERTQRDWTPGDGEPQPMNRAYFNDDARQSAERTGESAQDKDPVSRAFEAIENGVEDLSG
jgi:hypothetical protein